METEKPIENVNDLIEIVKNDGYLQVVNTPTPVGYTKQRQKKEWWHFVLTNDPERSVFTIRGEKSELRSFQYTHFKIDGMLTNEEDLKSFVLEMIPNSDWEVKLHVHAQNPQKILVIRIFQDMNIPIG